MRSVLYSRCDDQLWEGFFPSPLVSVNHLACLCDHMPFFSAGLCRWKNTLLWASPLHEIFSLLSLFSITFLDCIEGAST